MKRKSKAQFYALQNKSAALTVLSLFSDTATARKSYSSLKMISISPDPPPKFQNLLPIRSPRFTGISTHFPDTAEFTDGMDSKVILKKTIELIATKGYRLGNIDATICAERPKMNPHIPAMKACMAQICGCDEDDISIKATTTEKLGFTGREEGISAYAVVLIEKD